MQYSDDLTKAQTYISSSNYSSNTTKDKAFDDITSTYWMGGTDQNQYVGIKFNSKECIRKITILNSYAASGARIKNFYIQYSDDGVNYNNADNKMFISSNSNIKQTFTIDNNGSHLYWRLFILNNYCVGYPIGIVELEMMSLNEFFLIKDNNQYKYIDDNNNLVTLTNEDSLLDNFNTYGMNDLSLINQDIINTLISNKYNFALLV